MSSQLRTVDVRAVQEFEAAELHKRNVAPGEFELQQGAVVGGAEQHRLLLEYRADLAVAQHLLDDVARLIGFIAHGDKVRELEALSLMTERARFMARQPGFVSISLHRSLDGRRIVNYIQWQSRELLQKAHKSPEFRKEWARFDQLTDEIDLHLYEVVHLEDSRT